MTASTFTARYAGTCASCPVRIQPDDEVTYDGADGLIHAVCPEDVVAKHGEPCGRCFIELPLTGVCPDCD